MTDIVPILRDCAQSLKTNGGWKNTSRYMSDAADEISALRTERDAVRKALGDIQYYSSRWQGVSIEAYEWILDRIAQANAEAEGRKP